MIKEASILDFPRPTLDRTVWESNNTLKTNVKKFILDFISSFAQANNFKAMPEWTKQVRLVGSLCTNTYTSQSDCDIHIAVDLKKFIELEGLQLSEQEASDRLDEIRKQVDQVKANLPESSHPVEIYFETDLTPPTRMEWSGAYDLLSDKWLAGPHFIGKDFDVSAFYPDLIAAAKEAAGKLDVAFGEVKQDVQDIKWLEETVAAWPQEQRVLFEKKLQEKLDALDEEIKALVETREEILDARHKSTSATSRPEILMKYLQKYFYLHVLTDLKALVKQSPELTTKDIPVVENIMSQASLNKGGYFISPEGEVFELEGKEGHFDFVREMYETTALQPEKQMQEMFSNGWARVREGSYEVNVEVADLRHLPPHVEKFLDRYPENIELILQDSKNNVTSLFMEDTYEGLQKAVNKALQQKRMQTAAYADLPTEEQVNQVIMVDVDDTISHENPDGSMGEPIKGAKEVLQKIKDQGYTIVLDSHRANTDEGREEIKNWMDKHEIPYDEFFMGDKPLAFRYIDDRAIAFTDWASVLKEVEKAENHKAASLSQKYWIDPNGKEINIGEKGHIRWVRERFPSITSLDEIDSITEQLLKEGWTRVTTGHESSHNSDFAMEVASLNRIPPYLDNFVAKHFEGKGVEIDDLEGNFIKIDDPFPSLQKSVNKALRQPQQVLSKKEAVYNPYQDESLKQGPAYAVYIGEQSGFEGLPSVRLYNIFGDHPRFGSTVTEATLKELNIPVRETKTAQLGSEYDYSSTQFNLPKELSEKIIRWAVENIPETDLYLEL